MYNLNRYVISPDSPFREAISELDKRATQILLIVDPDDKLIGTVTDGDMRRALLRNFADDTPLSQVMNPAPLKVLEDCTPQQAKSLMHANRIHHLPIVDVNNRLKGVFTEDSLIGGETVNATAILMVGGYGRRLGIMTSDCPKPMLKIGGKPILQTIVEQLRDAGITDIVLAVNYLASQIKDYFGDGGEFAVQISYLEEDAPLGTAGALRLLDYRDYDRPLLVMNGDILTRVNFMHLVRFHTTHDASATMCVREFHQQVPYGVVRVDGLRIESIEEKPASRFFINSGIYVIDPGSLEYLTAEGALDMPSFFDLLREQQKLTLAYPIHEYWADIGNPEEFRAAELRYSSEFIIQA